MKVVPTKLTKYNVYDDFTRLVGIGDEVTLPYELAHAARSLTDRVSDVRNTQPIGLDTGGGAVLGRLAHAAMMPPARASVRAVAPRRAITRMRAGPMSNMSHIRNIYLFRHSR